MEKFLFLFIILLNILLISILTGLLLYLILRKKKYNRRLRRKEILKSKLSPYLQNHFLHNVEFKTRILQNDPLFFEVLEDLLNHFGMIMKSEETENKTQVIAREFLSEYYVVRMKHPRWSIRMNTLFQIEDFRIDTFRPNLWNRFEELSNNDAIERMQIIKTLASLQDHKLISFLLVSPHPFSKVEYKEVLRRLNDNVLISFIDSFSKLYEPFQIALIEFIGEQNDIHYLPFVEAQVNNPSLEMRLSTMKTLSSLGYMNDYNKILPLSKSTNWEERMIFARLCGSIKKERSKSTLIQLLEDESWFVRNAAGEALSQYNDGNYILTHIVQSHQDPFAKDMALQWLERSEDKE
ncbi:HEAT repeat domain-containing protein [Rossellomorea aquimaris]|uniref:HEAT repeat domain-containing protein n=1 Tax=Rossellomorea aquimaris TaxID=189382 RepID=UPI0007D0768F|nr:HEAT repeat domain-containing protein [Rossellomorea aquimaris]